MSRETRRNRKKTLVPVIAVAGALSLGATPLWAQQSDPRSQQQSDQRAQMNQSGQSRSDRASQSEQRAGVGQNLISAENLRDQRVVDGQNRDIGTITNLYIDPQSGRVARADIDFSTTMFGPNHKYSVEWDQLKVQRQGDSDDVVVTLDQSIVQRVQQAGRDGRATEGNGIYNQRARDVGRMGSADADRRDRSGGVLGFGDSDRNAQISASQLSSDQIREVQRKLNQEGFHAGEVDGNWSSQMQTAIRNFQQTNGLNATGQLDEQTLDELGLDADDFRSAGQSQTGSGSRANQSGTQR